MKYGIKAFVIALGLLFFSGIANSATLTAATGGSAIASNTAAGCSAAGTWTALTGPTITESVGGEIGLGTIILSAPAGFVFNTASAVTILLTGNGTNTRNINNTNTGTAMATSVTATAITFTVTSVSSRANTLTWQGIQVRPTSSAPLATGNITETGTAATSGIAAGANYGTLTEVASVPVCNPSLPAVTTNAATGLTSSGATLNGTISSNGATTTATFDYGLDTTYGSTVTATASPLAAGATNTAVSGAITGLTCGGTTYHFRVKGVNSVGTSNGSDATFTTPACVVTLGKTVSTASAAVGSYVTFNLTATNANTIDLTNVTLTDSIPVGLTYITNAATQGTATASGQVLTWSIPYLQAGSDAQLTLVVQPTARGTYTNTVTSTGATSANATILILPSAITRYSMDEPVGTWNGTAGEVIDSGGNGLNGHRRATSTPTTTNTVVPNPTIASQHSIVGGFCNAGYFDGNAVVESASSPFFQFAQTLSASAWIYPTAYPTGNNGQDLSSILSNDVNYEFHLNPGGHLYWWWSASTLTSAAVIPLNQWTHIAITFDSTAAVRRQRIYINGVQDANTNNWSGTLSTNNCPFYIGGDISTGTNCTLLPGRNFHGMIDEAKIYNYELSAAEVQADMTLGRQCGATSFNHIRIVHDGTASTCTPKVVTIKACMDSGCNSLYPGTVTAHLTPTGWSPGTNDTVTITGGVASVTLSNASISAPTLTLGGTATGSVLPSNTTVRCFNGSTETCTLNVAATSCTFDAAEPGANPQTHLYTKLAGTSFTVDVLALSNSTTVNTNYTGTVKVDLVDTSTAACSASSTVLSTTQPTITYTAANKGRYPVSLTCPTATQSAQVRITAGASSPACSYDKLAVRPTTFNVTSTDATNSSATSTPAIKSGSAFNLTAASVAGYNGTPSVDNTKVTGTPVAGTLSGSFSAAPVATGTATGSFTYSEAGNFGLSQDAVNDSTFTAVDQPGDCVTASTSNVLTGGKYGCSIGSVAVAQTTGSSGFGRFIPDHFETAINQVSGVPMSPCPTGSCPLLFNGFVYSGQAFTTQVTAKNAICPGPGFACATTRNYAGSYARNVTLTAWDALGSTIMQNPLTGSLSSGTLANNSIASAAFSSGIATTTSANSPTYALLASIPPTNIYMRATEASGGDGVTSLRTPSSSSVEGGVMVVNGRIKALNAYGSELLPLTLMATAQYYSANGWVNSTTDNVTTLAPTYSGIATTKTLTPATRILNLGSLSIKFAAPGAAGTVTVTPSIDPASPGNPPLTIIPGTATFGVYKDNNGFIYRRESY